MTILSREKTQDCWVRSVKNVSWKQIFLFSLASWQDRTFPFGFPFGAATFDGFLSCRNHTQVSSEVSRKAFCRNPMVSLDSLVALFIALLLQLETSGCRCSFFCWKRRNLPSLPRSYADPEGRSQKAARGRLSPRLFTRMYNMQWPENKAIKLPYPSVITRNDEI